ncbi:MAG: DUF167 domain-containing protein [Planctomycetaceae bacterium]|nr:DUF167 domain-containing protein [Planctomycetaceae bacterium]
MSVRLEVHAAGVVLPVRAQPGSKKNGLRGAQDGMLKVTVTQIAEKGKATQAVVEVICDQLSLRKSQLTLLSGETSQQKRFLVQGVTLDELASRVEQALSAGT